MVSLIQPVGVRDHSTTLKAQVRNLRDPLLSLKLKGRGSLKQVGKPTRERQCAKVGV